MMHVRMTSTRAHDSKAFNDSKMHAQLHGLRTRAGDPIKCLADAAHAESTHVTTTKTRAQLN